MLFGSITRDLFPGSEVPSTEQGLLEESLLETCDESNLQPEKGFIEKCFQLSDTMSVRHGMMCVGQAFSGKSKVIETLAKAFTRLKKQEEFLAV